MKTLRSTVFCFVVSMIGHSCVAGPAFGLQDASGHKIPESETKPLANLGKKDPTLTPQAARRELDAMRQTLTRLTTQREQLRSILDEETHIEIQIKDQIQKLEGEIAPTNLNSSGAEEVERLLTTRRVDLIVDIAGLSARQENLLRIQHDAAKKRNESSQEEIELLEQLVQLATEKLLRARELSQKGLESTLSLNEIEQELIQAKLNLLEKKNQLTRTDVGIDSLEPVSLELAEKKARLEIVEALLTRTTDAKSKLNSLVEAKQRLQQLRSARINGQAEALSEAEKQCIEWQVRLFEAEQALSEDK